MRGDEEQTLLVIGVGNRYRGDDGAGVAVARRISDLHLRDVVVREETGEGSSLVEAWANASNVIIVDAASSGSTAGTIHRFNASNQSIPTGFLHYSSHAFGVAEAIEVARALSTLPQQLVVFGIEGARFSTGVGLSPEVELAADDVASSIVREFHSHPEPERFPFH